MHDTCLFTIYAIIFFEYQIYIFFNYVIFWIDLLWEAKRIQHSCSLLAWVNRSHNQIIKIYKMSEKEYCYTYIRRIEVCVRRKYATLSPRVLEIERMLNSKVVCIHLTPLTWILPNIILFWLCFGIFAIWWDLWCLHNLNGVGMAVVTAGNSIVQSIFNISHTYAYH